MRPNFTWEFWLDCNISPIIAKWLSDETGYIFKSAFKLNLYSLSDIESYLPAKSNPVNVILISKDTYLPQLINKFGAPPKLISLQIGNTDNSVLYKLLVSNLQHVLSCLLDENSSVVHLG